MYQYRIGAGILIAVQGEQFAGTMGKHKHIRYLNRLNWRNLSATSLPELLPAGESGVRN